MTNVERVLAYLRRFFADFPDYVQFIETRLLEAAGLYNFDPAEGVQTERQRLIVTLRATISFIPLLRDEYKRQVEETQASVTKARFSEMWRLLDGLEASLWLQLKEALTAEGVVIITDETLLPQILPRGGYKKAIPDWYN